MYKKTADRGVRTEESGVVKESTPLADSNSGDEGIDDMPVGKPFRPGRPEQYVKLSTPAKDTDP
jgi:hypothetical protein